MTYNKYIYTLLKLFYISLIPFWLINIEVYFIPLMYVMYWLLGDIVISIFLHRWGAHNLWNPPSYVKIVLSFLGVGILQGNALSWAAWHRTHHKHVDTEKDPHSPKYNNWFYIVILNHFHKANYRLGVDRARDNFLVWINKYEGMIALLFCAILYFTLSFDMFMTLWAVPVALLNIFPGLGVNYWCHSNGKAQNKLYLWPLIFSECMHADHHHNVKLVRNCWDPFAHLIIKLKWN